MASAKVEKEQMMEKYGNECWIDKLGLRDDKNQRVYKDEKERKKKKMITYHHIKKAEHGGEISEENGALLSSENHEWLNQKSRTEQNKLNSAFKEYKQKFNLALVVSTFDAIKIKKAKIIKLNAENYKNEKEINETEESKLDNIVKGPTLYFEIELEKNKLKDKLFLDEKEKKAEERKIRAKNKTKKRILKNRYVRRDGNNRRYKDSKFGILQDYLYYNNYSESELKEIYKKYYKESNNDNIDKNTKVKEHAPSCISKKKQKQIKSNADTKQNTKVKKNEENNKNNKIKNDNKTNKEKNIYKNEEYMSRSQKVTRCRDISRDY